MPGDAGLVAVVQVGRITPVVPSIEALPVPPTNEVAVFPVVPPEMITGILFP
jgi:hypothetical protein